MPILLIFAGLILIVSGYRRTVPALAGQLKDDAVAFASFGAVVLIVGFIGISKSMRPLSNVFLVLIFVVFFLRNGTHIASGVQDALKSPTSKADAILNGTSEAAPQPQSSSSSSSVSPEVVQAIADIWSA